MIIYGNRLFGKVDTVPGLGFVATRFFHIDYLPLIPTEGWLVFHTDGKGWRGIRVPMSGKSILFAWLRTASVVGGVGGIIGLIINMNDNHSSPMDLAICGTIAAVSVGFFAFSKMHKSMTHASFARACELGKLAKLNDKGMAAIAAVYGQAPISFGFEPLPAAPVPVAPLPVRPGRARAVPVAPIPVEEDEVDVESISVEALEASAAQEQQPAATPPPVSPQQPRQEVRRHG